MITVLLILVLITNIISILISLGLYSKFLSFIAEVYAFATEAEKNTKAYGDNIYNNIVELLRNIIKR